MQSQQSSAIYHNYYNKLTRADHAVMRIAPVRSAPMHADQISINISSPARRLSLFPFFKPNTKTLTYNLCKSYNQWILLLPVVFPDLDFHKKILSLFFCDVYYFYSDSLFPYSHLCGSTVRSLVVEIGNLHHRVLNDKFRGNLRRLSFSYMRPLGMRFLEENGLCCL